MAKRLIWLVWLESSAILTILAMEPSIRTITASQLIIVALYMTKNLQQIQIPDEPTHTPAAGCATGTWCHLT